MLPCSKSTSCSFHFRDKISVSSENENETKYIPPKMAAASLTNITTPENPSNNQRKRLLSQNINTGIVYK